MSWMLVTSVPLWEIVFRTVVVYIGVFALLRLAGKRELGQMNVTDLVVILVIANAVQNSLNGGDTSLIGGLVAAATLVIVNILFDRYGRHLPFFTRVLEEHATLLLKDGKMLDENCARENVTKDEIEMAAREHGIDGLSQVSAAVLEVDGSISIIPKEGSQVHRVKRIRQFRSRP